MLIYVLIGTSLGFDKMLNQISIIQFYQTTMYASRYYDLVAIRERPFDFYVGVAGSVSGPGYCFHPRHGPVFLFAYNTICTIDILGKFWSRIFSLKKSSTPPPIKWSLSHAVWKLPNTMNALCPVLCSIFLPSVILVQLHGKHVEIIYVFLKARMSALCSHASWRKPEKPMNTTDLGRGPLDYPVYGIRNRCICYIS